MKFKPLKETLVDIAIAALIVGSIWALLFYVGSKAFPNDFN